MHIDYIKQVCEEYGVKYSHHDEFDQPPYKHYADDIHWRDLQDAVCVIYPGPYKPWCLAINSDYSVTWPGKKMIEENNQLIEKMEQLLKDSGLIK